MILINQTDFSAVDIVEQILQKAVKMGASDIHLEPSFNLDLRVRFRLDGVLHDQTNISKEFAPRVVSRIKVLSNLDIAKKRVPQDGKCCLNCAAKDIDLRISTFPCVNGEKVVVRLLDRSENRLDLEELGFEKGVLEKFKNLIQKQNGFFLVSGPTGSGKTTTLYSALSRINSPEKNIVTLEDPVEYRLDGVSQGQIHPESGFTFESGMRSLLRQDPDVVMIGEIRDRQTAKIAIEASLTGHLVFSTVHTNDATSVVMRLIDMGIEPFLINSSLTGVLAQRLVRKNCMHCKEEVQFSDDQKRILENLGLNLTTNFVGKGCASCLKTGYKGRIGLFELLTISSALKSLIVDQPMYDDIFAQAVDNGMQTLLESGIQKVKKGDVSFSEVCRVLL
ncbi:MAG: General secretion pathway protein E (Type II traffic warden ATPase)(Cholera toxin secretion protein EpsE) [candidate division TM6 bacterium GW2011_GWF2_32_72]|nr:MAG: General secretion pathway protein E (Type II traffic warden ATPase)(Cholera toxin secretion protein EpsE) [candidate division TM6 bacterium GW2011_GWF2_32_72]